MGGAEEGRSRNGRCHPAQSEHRLQCRRYHQPYAGLLAAVELGFCRSGVETMSVRLSILLVSAVGWAMSGSVAAADPQPGSTQGARAQTDPSQRICEDITQVGSRLATKRICATRAEWSAMR